MRDGLADLDAVTIYCCDDLNNHAAVLLCNREGMSPGDFADILDGDFHIATRSGLHCAPLVHRDLGTSPEGAVRFSVGPSNTIEEIDTVVRAVRHIASVR